MDPSCKGGICIARTHAGVARLITDGRKIPFKVLNEARCARECEIESNLCTLCKKYEESYLIGENQKKSKKWHGRIGGPIAPQSHIEGSQKIKEINAQAKNAKNATKTNASKKRQTAKNRKNMKNRKSSSESRRRSLA